MHKLWEVVWRILKKLKIKWPYDPEIPLLGIYHKEMKARTQKGICASMFTAALYITAKRWRKKVATDRWISTMRWIHTVGCSSALERKGILTHATWMSTEEIIFSEISQSRTNIVWLLWCKVPRLWLPGAGDRGKWVRAQWSHPVSAQGNDCGDGWWWRLHNVTVLNASELYP